MKGSEDLLPTLRAAFRQAVPLIERNLPVTERRMPVIVATPALQERALAKSAALVAALTDALQARGVAEPLAALCARVGMDTYSIAIRRWGPIAPTTCTPTSTGPSPICGSPRTP
jgi:hypothetical protein